VCAVKMEVENKFYGDVDKLTEAVIDSRIHAYYDEKCANMGQLILFLRQQLSIVKQSHEELRQRVTVLEKALSMKKTANDLLSEMSSGNLPSPDCFIDKQSAELFHKVPK